MTLALNKKLNISNKIWVMLIFFHYLVYELIFFFYADYYGILGPATKIWKLLFPMIFFIVVAIPNLRWLRLNVSLQNYTIFFVLFLIWSLLVSFMVSADSIVEWMKLLPRFGFFLALSILFMKAPPALLAVLKLIVFWAILNVLMYFLLYKYENFDSVEYYTWGGRHAGPYGVLGNITSLMYFDSIKIPIVRLTGYWNEPSNASASLFASFFFARWIGVIENSRFWKKLSWVCFFGGFLCFSNAGYLAVSCAFLIGIFIKKRNFVKKIIMLLICVLIISSALSGRMYVTKYMPDNDYAKALVGLRDKSFHAASFISSLDGRIELVALAVNEVIELPYGSGMASNSLNMSASAPIMWLSMFGIPGLALLLLRELWIYRKIIKVKNRTNEVLLLSQAYIVVAVQQLSYGSWMNPLFFIATAAIFSSLIWHQKTIKDTDVKHI